VVVTAYLGWAVYGATVILLPHQPASCGYVISGVAFVVLGVSWTLFAIQRYPLTYYVYIVFPCYFWREALVTSSGPLLASYRSGKLRASMKLLLRAVFVIAALQSMVVRVAVFAHIPGGQMVDLDGQVGYTHRIVWSIGFLVIGFVWPAWRWPDRILEEHPVTCSVWILLCLATAVFPMLDVNQSENLGLM
jgi:phosphatidylinositol glycan class N